jgi:transcriptional regulator with XRE-family HTH domain
MLPLLSTPEGGESLGTSPLDRNSLIGNWPSESKLVSSYKMSGVRATQAPRPGTNGSSFGRLLKGWRNRRGLSQLDLALAVRTSQRHLSFIESGRAAPSRDMILRLSGAMDIPLRQQNALLLAAGYAPVWRERDLSAPDLAIVNKALDYMLGQHEPYPAFVVDHRWNVLRANRGAIALTEFLLGTAQAEPAAEPVNLAVALMSAAGLRPFITNWDEVAQYFLRGAQADAQADGGPETLALLNRLLELPDVAMVTGKSPPAETQPPVLPMLFRQGDSSLSLFSTIATLGTPRDVTLQEVRVECLFPMDEMTAQQFRDWARIG